MEESSHKKFRNIYNYEILRNGEVVYPEEIKDSQKGDEFSLWLDIEKVQDRDAWLKWLKYSVLADFPNLQFKSIIFGFNEKTVNAEKGAKTIKKILDNIKPNCSSLNLISIGRLIEEDTMEDMVFLYNEQLKKLAKTVQQENPNAQIAVVDLDIRRNIPMASSLEKIKENNMIVNEDEVENARARIKEIAKLIQSKTDSPYEQHLLALHYLSQYRYSLDESMPYSTSRSLTHIIKNDAKYICCAGYARFYTEIMREMGFDAQTQIVSEHLRAKVYLKDKKYGINGIYSVEPTWLSIQSNQKEHSFNFNKFANMSMKAMEEAYSRSAINDFTGKGLLEAHERRTKLFNKLEKELQYRKFNTYKELSEFLHGENLEQNDILFAEIASDLNKIYGKKEYSPVDEKDLAEVLEKNKPKLDPLLEDYLNKEPKVREKEMNKILDKNLPLLENKDIDSGASKYRALIELESAMLKDKIPYMIADTILESSINDKKIMNLKSKDKKYFIKFIKDKAVEVAKKGLCLNTSTKYILDDEDMKSRSKICSRNYINANDLQKKLTKNFTRLNDKEFKKVFDETKVIEDETLLKGVEAIKKLVKKDDYNLFTQDLSALREHEDEAYGM